MSSFKKNQNSNNISDVGLKWSRKGETKVKCAGRRTVWCVLIHGVDGFPNMSVC